MSVVGGLSGLCVPVVADLCEGLRRFARIRDSVMWKYLGLKIRNCLELTVQMYCRSQVKAGIPRVTHLGISDSIVAACRETNCAKLDCDSL
jgi:hypothetical protein